MFDWLGWNTLDAVTKINHWTTGIGAALAFIAAVVGMWATAIGTTLAFIAAFVGVAAFVTSMRKDQLAVTADRIRWGQQEERAQRAEKHLADERSTKTKLRKLFDTIDPQILRAIDSGQTELIIRMQPADIENLDRLLSEPGAGVLAQKREEGKPIVNSLISNGSLGPNGTVPIQLKVKLSIGRDLRSQN